MKSDQVSRIFGQLCSREVFALAPLTTELSLLFNQAKSRVKAPSLSYPSLAPLMQINVFRDKVSRQANESCEGSKLLASHTNTNNNQNDFHPSISDCGPECPSKCPVFIQRRQGIQPLAGSEPLCQQTDLQ